MRFLIQFFKRDIIRLAILLLLLSVHGVSVAQFKSASVRIDGLTCSMCSNSVEKLMRTLDFVQDIRMDLNSNMAEVTFKEGSKVEIKRLSKAVFDAGYSVGSLTASFYFDSLQVSEGTEFKYEDNHYRFVASGEKLLKGWVDIKFLGKSFQEKKEYQKSLTLYNSWLKEDKKKNIYYIQL